MKTKLTVCFRLHQHDTFRLKLHQAAYPFLVSIETKIKKKNSNDTVFSIRQIEV